MKTLELLNFGSDKLRLKGVLSYQLDSELILSKILRKSREKIITDLNRKITLRDTIRFRQFIERRSKKEPIAYLLGEKEFWSKNFIVNKNTLIPRPETELMIDKIIKIYRKKSINILDIGTGSGCIIISLLSELLNSSGVGIDISNKAILIAKKNKEKNNITNRLRLLKRSFKNIYNCKFDLIVSNPPYIDKRSLNKLEDDVRKYEPIIALDGGKDGLDVIEKVIYKAKYLLKINGRLALEIGNKQFRQVSRILKRNNFKIENNIKDFEENIRCIISNFKG